MNELVTPVFYEFRLALVLIIVISLAIFLVAYYIWDYFVFKIESRESDEPRPGVAWINQSLAKIDVLQLEILANLLHVLSNLMRAKSDP